MAFISAADAIAALRAAGHCVTRTTRVDAARRYGCQTALYVVDGRGVNIGRLRQLATLAPEPVAAEPVAPEPVAAEPVAAEPVAARPVLPGESLPPAPPAPHGAAAPVLPPTGDWMAGQPWDPGTPEARARVALQGERVATLWPIAQAVRGAGLTLPGAWASDGPVMAGDWPEARALAVLPSDCLRAAAVALAALPPVTVAQERALAACRAALAEPSRPL